VEEEGVAETERIGQVDTAAVVDVGRVGTSQRRSQECFEDGHCVRESDLPVAVGVATVKQIQSRKIESDLEWKVITRFTGRVRRHDVYAGDRPSQA